MPRNRLDSSFIIFFIRHCQEYFFLYVLAIISLYLTHLCQSYLPFWAKDLGDILMTGDGSEIGVSKFFLVAVCIVIFRTSSRLLFFYPARVQQKDLRVELLERLERVNPARYATYSSGQIYQIMFKDLSELRALFGIGILQIGNIVVALAVLMPKIIDFNPSFILAFLPMVVSVFIFVIIAGRYQAYFKNAFQLQGNTQNAIIESYDGKRTIRNYQSENMFVEFFNKHSSKELAEFYRAGKGQAFSIPLVKFGFGISLLWGAYLVKSQGLSASSLILFSGFAFLLLEPFMFLSWIGAILMRSMAAWKRVKILVDLLNTSSELERSLMEANNNLSNKYIFNFWNNQLSLEIDDNCWTVLIGKTGCGKTFVLKRVAEILKLRNKSCSMVAQVPYLYNDTIINNIFLGRDVGVVQRQEAFSLLQLFGMDYLETDMDALLDLEIGENGKQLSGGQKKRLCLVRSILSGDQYLIWDDPFSSIDFIMERNIITKLKESPLMSGKTVILSSHRISTVRFSDNLIFLEEKLGIVEQGSTVQLLLNNSETSRYFEKQLV